MQNINSLVSAQTQVLFEGLAAHLAAQLNLEEKDVLAAINSYSPKGVPKTKKAKSTAVKRPKSAFLFFGDEMRLTIKAENNDLKFGAVSKELGKRWKEVSAEEKKRFVDMAAEAKGCSSSSENEEENLLKKKHEKPYTAARAVGKCLNLSTNRALAFNDTNTKKFWNKRYQVCANTQEEIDEFLAAFNFVMGEEEQVEEEQVEEQKEEEQEEEQEQEQEEQEEEEEVEVESDSEDEEAKEAARVEEEKKASKKTKKTKKQ